MKERPILFNGEMVRAILEGKKTQTRRIVATRGVDPYTKGIHRRSDIQPDVRDCYIKEGDLLWVRETFSWIGSGFSVRDLEFLRSVDPPNFIYKADGVESEKWSPSIHMPRWASRITLKVTSVRVERLNDISDADAKAEGVKTSNPCGGCGEDRWGNCIGCRHPWGDSPASTFQSLWQSVYGKDSWSANPWVWVIEFEVQK